jgi:thiamine-monophosphate kinase
MEGLLSLARQFDVAVAGGDTNIWDGPLVVSVTLLGEPTGPGPVARSGARPGDWLMVTGALGGSLGGRHLTFQPRLREAVQLHQAVDLHAMIDISDGLASDAHHLLDAQNLGLVILDDAIPIHPDVDPGMDESQRRQRALSDGEDFELLLAVAPDQGQQLLQHPPFETPISKIGEFTNSPGCWLRLGCGERVPLVPTGWQHRFRS